MSHPHDTAMAASEVPWPDQPSHNPEILALCCPACGNNELVETSFTTDQGREPALQCDHCGEVCPDAS